uniref:ornithine decarboxylase n=1 Tax=Hemiscolopendra marginata TaxID=943146 RepID=A0A646QEW9_9MYRI
MKTSGAIHIIEDKSAWDIIREIASRPEQEEPFYVVDLSDLVWKHKQWKLKLPRVEPFYAVKCNDTTTVLEVLASLGTGFDCASKSEIQKVMDLGIDPSRIIYANPCKTASFIKYAAKQGVSLMTFDNEAELYKVKTLYPDAQMVLRIRYDAEAQCPLGIKFGVEPSQAPQLLKVAKELGINVVGVSFHVGSGCHDFTAYGEAIKAARWVFDYAATMGFDFDLLDIGGGYPGHKDSSAKFSEVASIVNDALDECFPEECGVRIIAEPGRYYVASAFTLCVNVIAKRGVIKSRLDGREEEAFMYYVNDGVYGSFNCLLFDHAEVTAIPLKIGNKPTYNSSLWGPTCDGLDCILKECELPVMDVGDWVVFEDMGAYTVAAASTFNGFQKPALNFFASRVTWLNLIVSPEKSSPPVKKSCHDVAGDIHNEGTRIEAIYSPELSIVDA